jgi:hypothetical protein
MPRYPYRIKELSKEIHVDNDVCLEREERRVDHLL